MDTLFDADEPVSSQEEGGFAEELPADTRDGVYRLSSNLRRFGAAKIPPRDVLSRLLEALTANPLFPQRLDDDLEVDSHLWNFAVAQLQQADYAGDLLHDIAGWPFYRDLMRLASLVGLPMKEMFIYNATSDMPSIVYCPNKKKFYREFTHSGRSQVSDIRYELVLEKTRNAHLNVTSVDAASRVSKDEQILIGTLGLDKQGDICIQGTISEIKLHLGDYTTINSGIYCDSSTVIVRCVMEPYKDAIRCIEISHPPLSIETDLPDFFGGKLTNHDLYALEARMKIKVDNGASEQWIMIADIHLDNRATLEALERVLDTLIAMYQYQGFPVGFVLMGNFMSTAFNTNRHTQEKYGHAFEQLAQLLVKPKFRGLLLSTYFVLVPGPGDATLCNQLLPMQPLLGEFTANLKAQMDAHLGESSRFVYLTNPCRIRHLTRRMVVCRSDLLNRLLCTSLLTSGAGQKITPPAELRQMLITTVLGQGHICPNKPGAHSILKYDSSLLLYPLPDLICICDTTCPSFIEVIRSTTVCNLESFSKSRSFVSYDAISGKCQNLAL